MVPKGHKSEIWFNFIDHLVCYNQNTLLVLYRKKLTSLLTGRDLEQDPLLAQVELQYFLKVIFVFHYYRKGRLLLCMSCSVNL